MNILWITSACSFLLSILGSFLSGALLTSRFPIVGTFLGFQLSENAGVAFGVQLGVAQNFIIIAAFLAVILIAHKTATTRIAEIGYGLIIGGGLANVLDRVIDGTVTDFIQVGAFPIFNIADSCISVGVALLLYELLLSKKPTMEQV